MIANSVSSIGQAAFTDCDALTDVTIPDSITSLGRMAFYCCDSLERVTLGSGLTSIAGYAFEACVDLKSVTFPKALGSIGERAFRGCHALTGVGIPDGVTSIGDYAFQYCDKLTRVRVPGSVTSIGNGAFQNCSGDLILYSDRGAFAEKYANDHHITFAPDVAVTVGVNDMTLKWKSKAVLEPTVTTPEGMGYTVAFSSSDPGVVSIDENGEMTGLKKGTATVTVTVTDDVNRTVTDSCKITVRYTVLQWIIVYLLCGWIWYKAS